VKEILYDLMKTKTKVEDSAEPNSKTVPDFGEKYELFDVGKRTKNMGLLFGDRKPMKGWNEESLVHKQDKPNSPTNGVEKNLQKI
jgi:hypothetical protein